MDEYLHKDSQWPDENPLAQVALREILCEGNKYFTVTTNNDCHMLLGEMMEPIFPEVLKIQLEKMLKQSPGKTNLRSCFQQNSGPNGPCKSIAD